MEIKFYLFSDLYSDIGENIFTPFKNIYYEYPNGYLVKNKVNLIFLNILRSNFQL